MKKKYLFLILSLSFTICTFAQNSVRVYNLDVKMGHDSDVARNFADYWDVEYKTGGMILQSVSFLKGVTHRVIASGDPSNWGTKIEKMRKTRILDQKTRILAQNTRFWSDFDEK